MRLSITGRSMLIYGFVWLMIISLTFVFSYWGTVGRLDRQLKETNMALLKQIDQKIEMAFQQTEKDLLQLTNELEFVYFMNNSYKDDAQRYANFYALNAKLTKFMNKNLQFSSIFVYSDITGDILTEKTFMKKDMSENQWLTGYLNMPNYFQWLTTHRIWDGEAHGDVITLVRSYPALSAPGYRTGLLAVNMKEEVLYQMIQGIYAEGVQGQTFILDEKGEVVTHDDKSKLYSNMKALPFVQRILSGKDGGAFGTELDGVKQTVFYKPSGYTGWTIVSVVPESQVYKPLTVMRNLLIAFALGMFVLACAVLFYVNRWAFKPVDRLISKLSGAYKPVQSGLTALAAAKQAPRGVSYLENVFDQMFLDREQLEKQVRDAKPMLKWRTVMDMLVGYRSEYTMVKHHLEFIGVRLYPERFVVGTAEIGKEGGIDPKDETLYSYALCNVAEEMINMEHAGVGIDLGGGRAVILFSFAEGDEEQNHLRAAELMEHVLAVMHKQIGLTVTAGIGRCYHDMKDIPLSYDESQQALRYKMVSGHHAVISIEDVQVASHQHYYRLSQMMDRIQEALKQAEGGRMQELVNEAFHLAVRDNLSPDLIRQFAFELVMRSVQTVESIGVQTEEALSGMGNVHERIQQCENWRDAHRLVLSVLEGFAGSIEQRRRLRGKNDTIEKVLVYIQTHYRDSSLSLDRLAGEFGLSPPYISKLFKEYTEGNFIDYLIEIRLQAAQELLRDKQIKVGDISDAVGYANSRSFLRAFKKYTGLTPTEFRERMVHEEKSEQAT
ncbi:helix-turn-helix domain-containing protein [Paenibacillus filicis]|uniref:Helix-turn-helix domain-containing protein n=1 Tax=Paenibacillus filicis TaxID=669464 RepID=A0ABU9DFN6_9BACL